MPGNERLTLELEAKTIGEQAVDKLAASLDKVVNIASKKPNDGNPHKTGYEEFPAKLKDFVEQPVASALGELEKLSKGFGSAGIAAAGTVGVIGAIAAASYEAAKSLGELGVQTQNISIKTGLSTREVGLFTFAAKAAGSDIGVFETAMRKLSQGIEDGGAEGAKTSKALSDLGIRTRELNGDVRPTGQIFGDIGEAMEHMESTTKRNALAVALFGRAGIELIPTLIHLKETLPDADKIGLGITTEEQTRYLDLYKRKIEEVDGAWSVAKRHFQEGIAGTFTLDVSGKLANFFDAWATGKSGIDPRKLFGSNFQADADPWSISQGSISIPPPDVSGDVIAKHFQSTRLNSKEGIAARISELEGKNKDSEAMLNGTGIGGAVAQQAVDSIAANQKLIDSLHLQLKRMEQSAGEIEAASKKLDDLRKEGHSFITFGAGKNQAVITDEEISKYNAGDVANQRSINPPTLDILGRDDSYIRSNSDLDALNTRDRSRISRLQVEAGSDYFKDAGHRDDIAIRGVNDEAERQARISGIGAHPEDALAVAARQRDIRLAALEVEKNIVTTSLDQAGAADKLYALEQRGRDAQLEYNERVADQLARQEEQFRSLSGSFIDSLFGGSSGISKFVESMGKDLLRTVGQNAIGLEESAIMKHIPHATDPKSTLGKLLQDTPFGFVDPLTKSASALDISAFKLSAAADSLHTSAMSAGSGGGSASGIGGSAIAADWAKLSANPMSSMPVNLPGPYDNPTRNPDAITEIDPNQVYGSPSIASNRLTLASTAGKIAAGGAVVGGVIGGIEGFGHPGAQGALNGSASIIGAASGIMALIPAIASSIPIVGGIVAAALPLISTFLGDPKQHRASEISKTLTEAQYFAPTALNESMTTDGHYASIDARGNLMRTGFSARPVVTDPYLYWGPNNTPMPVPGGTTSPYSAGATQPPVVNHYHTYHVSAMDVQSFHEFAQANHRAISDAAGKGLGSGDSLLSQRIRKKVLGLRN